MVSLAAEPPVHACARVLHTQRTAVNENDRSRTNRRAIFGQCRDTPTKHALRRRSGRIIRPITCSTAHNGRSARPQSSTLANLED